MADRDRRDEHRDPNADRETAWHGEDRYPSNNPDLDAARYEEDQRRRYGAGDYEERNDYRYSAGPRARWQDYDPGHDSSAYRDQSGPRWRGEAGPSGDHPRYDRGPRFADDYPRMDARRGEGRGESQGRGEGRSFWDRTRDELATWFGDRGAEQRRRSDGEHRGKGPRNYRRADERISDDVHDRLTDDPYLDATDIEVQVRDAEVTLSGRVRTRDDRRRAEDLAERVSGVTHVQNNLRADDNRPRSDDRETRWYPPGPTFPF
jgi:osmotically-inducible protein OsmY